MNKAILLAIPILILVLAVATIIYGQFSYARDIAITGQVVDIQWVTDNHMLPKFVIMDQAGNRIAMSQFTIALNSSTIKVGDRIIKEKGSEFCIVNGKLIRFSLY